jgi:hypothetical protein
MGSKIYVGGLPYSAIERFVRRPWGGGFCADHHGQVHGTIPRVWIRGDVLGFRGAGCDYGAERLRYGRPDVDGE